MMREIGTAAGWTLYLDEDSDRYFVRIEEVVSLLSNSGPARELLEAMLRADKDES